MPQGKKEFENYGAYFRKFEKSNLVGNRIETLKTLTNCGFTMSNRSKK